MGAHMSEPGSDELQTQHEHGHPTSEDEVEYCYGHPDTPTRLHCTRCNKPICGRCAVPASVGQHCVWCVAEARKSAPKVRSAAVAISPVVIGLISINVAIWLLQSVLHFSRGPGEFFDLLTLNFALHPLSIADGEWYRLLTPMFLHAPFNGTIFSLLHIGFNMYILRIYGPNVEEAFGSPNFLSMYLLAGLGGSALSYSLGSPQLVGVGASGAVFGVVGMLIVFLRRRRHRAFVQQYLSGLMLFLGLNLLLGFSIARIDNWAHIGGLLAGAALAFGLDAGDNVPVPAPRRVLTYAAVASAVLALILWRTSTLS